MVLNLEAIANKALKLEALSLDEALALYVDADNELLRSTAAAIRKIHKPEKIVTWQIDRNVNITNVCISGCRFCNFHCRPANKQRAFTTSIDEYCCKIEETLSLGGDQLLLQGGLHPNYDIAYYETIFRELKRRYPVIKLHALGPPEVYHIAKISGITIEEALQRLVDAGLESLPGAGAEILDSDIRKRISPGKCSAEKWLEVMHIAHKMELATSATMMYGHVETLKQRVEHLIKLRELQDIKGDGNYGFIAFIAWPFCGLGTALESEGVTGGTTEEEYLRLIAISRIVLNNIANIQASWLTVGIDTGIKALNWGANDMGSIMIEENVVSSAGVSWNMDARTMERAIISAGFTPRLRDQKYNFRELNFI